MLLPCPDPVSCDAATWKLTAMMTAVFSNSVQHMLRYRILWMLSMVDARTSTLLYGTVPWIILDYVRLRIYIIHDSTKPQLWTQ